VVRREFLEKFGKNTNIVPLSGANCGVRFSASSDLIFKLKINGLSRKFDIESCGVIVVPAKNVFLEVK